MKNFFVTEKNMWTVAGHINTFLKKQVQEYEGKRKVVVGYEDVKEVNGFCFKRPILEEKDTFVPFLMGNCHLHFVAEGKDISTRNFYKTRNSLFSNSVLLAISSPFNDSCVPISYGNRVTITGNKLIIVDNEFGKKMKCFNGSNVRVFVQKPYNEQEKEDSIVSAIKSSIMNNIYYEMWNECFDPEVVSELRSMRNHISLENVGLTYDDQSILFGYDEGNVEIFLHLNVDKIKKEGLSGNPFTFVLVNGDNPHMVYHSLSDMMEDYVIKTTYNPDNEEDDDEEDWDW